MDQRGDEVHTSSTEATGASREGVVRWVLVVGLLLAAGFLTLIWVTGSLSQDEEDSHQNVGREIGAQQGTDANSGEPIAPAFEDAAAATAPSGTALPAHPDAKPTPGDAPAGDPRPDAQ
jgi:hypothetical protein